MYVNYVQSPNIFGNYGVMLHKNVKKKKKREKSLPTLSIFSSHATLNTHIVFIWPNQYLFLYLAEEPPDPPLYPHLVHKPGTYIQELYRKACKEYGVVRSSKFYKSLTTDKIIMRRQRLGPLDVKTCAIALMVNVKC